MSESSADLRLIMIAQREQAKTLAQIHEELKQLVAVFQAINDSIKSVAGSIAAGNMTRR